MMEAETRAAMDNNDGNDDGNQDLNWTSDDPDSDGSDDSDANSNDDEDADGWFSPWTSLATTHTLQIL